MSGGIDRLPKVVGSDVEFGNVIISESELSFGAGDQASRALLNEVRGVPSSRRSESRPSYSCQDWGRKFWPTIGGASYIDMDHLEFCTPEVRSASDYVAVWRAVLGIAQTAQKAANVRMRPGERIVVTVDNTDRQGASWGSHLSFLVSRKIFDELCVRKSYVPLSFLMAYQCSSIVFTGAGKVGSENDRPPVAFQLSQRADFFETICERQTTYRRPLVNSRDEPLCGKRNRSAKTMARLHVIFFDSTLAPVSTFLKVGVLQIILAMCEAGYMNPRLCLLDPLDAIVRWSHDPDLRARARLVGGSMVTAVELQCLFLEQAKIFVERGCCEGIVPEAGRIISLWEDTLLKLGDRDLDGLAPRLDWVMRRLMIERAMSQNGLGLGSPEASHLDVLFSSLDPEEGLYWSVERAGLVEPIVTKEEIYRFATNPPEDTRAWTRAMLLRRAGPGRIDSIDWDRISMIIETEEGLATYRTIWLENPLALTRAGTERLFDEAPDLLTLTTALGASERDFVAFTDEEDVPPHEGYMH